MTYRPVKQAYTSWADIYIDGVSVGFGAIKFADGHADVRVRNKPDISIRCTAAVHVGDDGVYMIRLFRLPAES